MSPENYTHYLQTIARSGYLAVAPKFNMHIFVDVSKLIAETERLLDSLNIPDTLPGCVGGHSMGGFVALKMSPKFRCLVLLSPYIPPGRMPDSITVPTLIFAGGKDFLTPSTFHQKPLFERIRRERVLIFIPAGTHNMYLDRWSIWDMVAGWPPIFPKRFWDEVARYTVRFLDAFLQENRLGLEGQTPKTHDTHP